MAGMSDIQTETKTYLRRYKQNRENVQRLHERLMLIEDKMKGVRSPRITGMPRGGTPLSMEDLIVRKSELEFRINALQERGTEIRREIQRAIDGMNNRRYAEVLESYFIDCLPFEDIAENTGYNIRHVLRLYSEGIDCISNVIFSSSK